MPETPEPPSSSERLAPGIHVAADDLRFTSSRSGGPGGQAVNKLNTQVQLHVAVSAISGLSEAGRGRLRRLAGQRLTSHDEIVIQAQTHRSQLDNRRACLVRLAQLVAEAAVEPKRRKKSRPSRAMIERRLAAKRRRSDKKSSRRWRRED